jgi:hypothetical protein
VGGIWEVDMMKDGRKKTGRLEEEWVDGRKDRIIREN